MKYTNYSFDGTEVYSKDFTRRYFTHSEYGEVYVSRSTQGWDKKVGDERMVDVSMSMSQPFEVLEYIVFGGKTTVKQVELKVETHGEDEEETIEE